MTFAIAAALFVGHHALRRCFRDSVAAVQEGPGLTSYHGTNETDMWVLGTDSLPCLTLSDIAALAVVGEQLSGLQATIGSRRTGELPSCRAGLQVEMDELGIGTSSMSATIGS